jgi:LysR family transcriptional activator of glutamate synthase operon
MTSYDRWHGAVEAVARHRHFTRAAEELHIAQSALSHQIRRLERELGTALFERTSRRVRTTEAGEAVAARARRVLAEVDGARDEVDELRGVLRGRIWIGALLPAGELDVPGLLARFSQEHPGVEVGLREGIAADMLRFLAAGELDAAFCPATRTSSALACEGCGGALPGSWP